jgi:N-acetyl-anhydromuramyl-L-alanine amidase AmpD
MAIKDGDKKPQTSVEVNVHTVAVTPDGTVFGNNKADKIAFHGAAPVGQRSGVAQFSVITTAPTSASPYGYSQAQATAIITLLNEIRAALVEKGIIQGS